MCKRAYLRRELSELNVSNELTFIRKAIQIKKEDQISIKMISAMTVKDD
jgi:hypothetical protein